MLFCQKEPLFIAALTAHKSSFILENQWQFSLPELFDFLQAYYPNITDDYLTFRRLLFNSPINQQLGQYQTSIVILKAADHVDNTIYCLQN